jgi:anti-anti-sigma factor
MTCGKVSYAVRQGTWVLVLHGDVRATWCASLDALVQRMLADESLRRVIIDLRDTQNVDSTMLGMLAKIAIRTRERLAMPPLLVAPNADVRRLLESMCMERVFDIVVEVPADMPAGGNELTAVERPESELCRQVAEAHRVLMDIDERNRATFGDVVAAIENAPGSRH